MQPDTKPTVSFVGPALTLAELAEVLRTAQENGIAAGIDKHFQLADSHTDNENDNMPKISVGHEFQITCEVTREVGPNDTIKDAEGKDVPVNNTRGNKFWARRKGDLSAEEFLICTDLN